MFEARRPVRGLLVLLVCMLGCDISVKKPTGQVVLVGRVFSAEQAQPLAGVEVTAPDGTVTKSGADGSFTLRHSVDKEGAVQTKSADHAPVSKDAPKGDGYVELYVKDLDGKKDVSPKLGGKVDGKDGLSVSVEKDTLVDKEGKAASNARVEIASPDPRKPTDLPAIPGNFDAKSGGKRGKISAESPVYVRAHDGDKELSLSEGKSVEADMPVRRADTSSDAALFRFDPIDQSWVFVKNVPRVGNKSGKPILNAQVDPGEPVYRAELDELGWWSVGEFFDQLTCVRACVVDGDGKGVPFARAVATGVDHFTQLTTYADDKGCFALDVRAKAQISLAVQAIDGYVESILVETDDVERTIADGASQCANLGELKLKEADAGACPLGLRSCGDACVDIRSDTENCGACDKSCGGSTGREQSCIDGVCSCPLGQRACTGGDSKPSTMQPDDGVNTAPQDAGVRQPPTSGSGMGETSDDMGSECKIDADCPASSRCLGGICYGATAPAPAEGSDGTRIRAQTAGYCTAVSTDDSNCGGCGIVCATGSRCVNGACSSSGAGGGNVAPRPDASVPEEVDDPSRVDAGKGGETACGFCPDKDLGSAGIAMGCCQGTAQCGLLVNSTAAQAGFVAGACIARDQPGTPTSSCPPLMRSSVYGPVMLAGCCRMDATCGYNASQASVGAAGTIDFGTGCISESDANTGLTPKSCDPNEGPDTELQDSDGDGTPDQFDNCPGAYNEDQADNDKDGQGNVCDGTPDGGAPPPPDGGVTAAPPDGGAGQQL